MAFVPGYEAMVERFLEVEVTGLDQDEQLIKVDASGCQARILQHECDHLDVILFVDKMEKRTFRTIGNHKLPIAKGCPQQGDDCIPRKVNIFMWRFMLDRLSHHLNLSLRGIDIPSIGCPLCNANVESSNHVFFDCDNAKAVWSSVRDWCDLSFPAYASFVQVLILRLFSGSCGLIPGRCRIFAATLWWLWRFRNNIIFGHHSIKRSDIYDNIRSFSFSWLHHRGRLVGSWSDWLKSPIAALFGMAPKNHLHIKTGGSPLGHRNSRDGPDGIFRTHLSKLAQKAFYEVCFSAVLRWGNKICHARIEDKVMELGVDIFGSI
ncbi:RNA-directed DNA polymerase, eukaryota [Tanacetum coccineum]